MTTKASPLRMRYAVLGLMTLAQMGASIVQQGLGSLGPFFAAAFDINKAQLGLLFATLMGGAAATTAISGLAVDRFGERAVILWSGVAMGVCLIAAAAVPAYGWLVVWLAVFGVFYAASTPAGGRAVLSWFSDDRGFAMGIRQTGVPVGGFIGALLLPFIASFGGYRTALVVGAVLCTGCCAFAALAYHGKADDVHGARPLRQLIAGMARIAGDTRALLVSLSCMVLSSVQSSMLSFIVVTLVSETRIAIGAAAAALAVAQIGAMAGRIVWGVVSDRVFGGDRMLPIVVLCVIASAGSLGIAHLSPRSHGVALALCLVLGFSAAGWNGLYATAQAEIGGAELAGSALGIGLTWVFLAGVAAPPLFGTFADLHGLRAAWMALAGFSLVGVIPALAARRLIAQRRLRVAA